MTPEGQGGGSGEIPDLDDLEAFAAQARVDQAIGDRTRHGALRRQGEETASFTDLLVDLAERQESLAIELADGARLHGVPLAVGRDHLRLHGDTDHLTLVPLSSIGWVALAPTRTRRVPVSPRRIGDRTLQETLADAVPERPRVRAQPLGGGSARTGTLRAVSADSISIEPDGVTGLVHGPLRSMAFVAILDHID